MKLLIEPFVQPYSADGFEVSRSGAEGETVKSVEDAVVALNLRGVVARTGMMRNLVRGGYGRVRWG